MLSKEEESATEKVIISLSERIIKELKDTSIQDDESALADLILGFAKLLSV